MTLAEDCEKGNRALLKINVWSEANTETDRLTLWSSKGSVAPFQNESKFEIFQYHANKTHFHMKGFAFGSDFEGEGF